jgi:hypothetical protein
MTALANIISKEIFFLHQYIVHTEEYNDIHLQQLLSYMGSDLLSDSPIVRRSDSPTVR